jgi:hypothetical protein
LEEVCAVCWKGCEKFQSPYRGIFVRVAVPVFGDQVRALCVDDFGVSAMDRDHMRVGGGPRLLRQVVTLVRRPLCGRHHLGCFHLQRY